MRRESAETLYLRQTHEVALHKAFLDDSKTVAGFLYVDLPNAVAADGIVRRAKKVLQDGAKNLARSRTYSWALLEQKISGASGGIHDPEQTDATLQAFTAAMAPLVENESVSLRPAKGLRPDAFEPLRRIDQRGVLTHAVTSSGPVTHVLVAKAAVHAAQHVGETLEGADVIIDAPLGAVAQIADEVHNAGAKIVGLQTDTDSFLHRDGINAENVVAALNVRGVDSKEAISKLAEFEGWQPVSTGEFWATPCQAAFIGSNMGRLDHELAATMDAKVVVPLAPLPHTARALATMTALNTVVIPDFVVLTSELAPYLSTDPLPDPTDLQPMIGAEQLESLSNQSISRVEEILDTCRDHPDGMFIAASLEAERFLSSWQDELPFGRPLA